MSHIVCFTATQLCCCSMKVGIDNLQIYEHACVLIKLYLQIHVVGQILNIVSRPLIQSCRVIVAVLIQSCGVIVAEFHMQKPKYKWIAFFSYSKIFKQYLLSTYYITACARCWVYNIEQDSSCSQGTLVGSSEIFFSNMAYYYFFYVIEELALLQRYTAFIITGKKQNLSEIFLKIKNLLRKVFGSSHLIIYFFI